MSIDTECFTQSTENIHSLVKEYKNGRGRQLAVIHHLSLSLSIHNQQHLIMCGPICQVAGRGEKDPILSPAFFNNHVISHYFGV